MIQFQEIFHVGVRVVDIDVAMADLGRSLGLTWASVQTSTERSIWTPERGLETVELTFVYSSEGPQHVELLQGQRGTVWDAGEAPGLHHVGVWSDDVASDVDRCLSDGWRIAAAGLPPTDGFGAFAYVVPPSGLVVELVTSAARPRFDAWWAGGPMGSERG
jgi:lactoylglutathione lyase